MIGYSGRNISLTEGILWAELVNRFVIEAFNSSVTPFTYWYNDGAWQSVSANLISNTQYNNFGVGLANLVGSRYATHWVYAVHDSTIHVVYGRESHSNLASALNEPIPSSLPGLLSAYATFVGRVIIQNGQDILQADSPFIESFAVAGVTDHNDLANIGEDDHHNRLHSLISEEDHETEIEHAEKVTGWDHEGKPTAREVTPLETEPLPIVPLIIESTDTRLLVEHGEEIRLTVQPFVQTFTVADWTVTAGGYYIDFVHGFQSDVKSELKSGTKKVHAQTVSISNIIERIFVPSDPDLRFEGTIIITK